MSDEFLPAQAAEPVAVKALDDATALERARKIVSGRGFNRPADVDGERLVGWFVPEEVAGLSEALFALDAIRSALSGAAPQAGEDAKALSSGYAPVSADAIAVLLSEITDIQNGPYVAVQIASLIEAGLAATHDHQVKNMVERFLRWRLPENFNPDGGISFKATYNEHSPFGPSKAEPVGTNLFDYTQAEAMVRHMLAGLPVAAPPVAGWRPTHRHKKRGSEYQVVAQGRLQVYGDLDMERVTIYRARNGETWVRLTEAQKRDLRALAELSRPIFWTGPNKAMGNKLVRLGLANYRSEGPPYGFTITESGRCALSQAEGGAE